MQTYQWTSWFTLLLATALIGCDRQPTARSPALKQLVDAIDAGDVDGARKALAAKPELEPSCGPYEICKPLALAAGRGNLEILKLLINAGADPNGKNAYGDTAFITADHAIQLSHKTVDDVRQVRRYLIEHGTDVNQPNAFGMTPFMGLCATGDIELARLALQHGADVNAAFNPTAKSNTPGPDPGGNTALILAAQQGQAEVVAFLLENEAQVDHANNAKLTALDVAQEKGHSEIAKMLMDAAAKTTTHER